jgi:hypothetical protein
MDKVQKLNNCDKFKMGMMGRAYSTDERTGEGEREEGRKREMEARFSEESQRKEIRRKIQT